VRSPVDPLAPATRLALVLCAIGLVAHQGLRAGWFIDDAAIGFAYARNLAEGHGLVPWPGGERIEAFSHPTWILLLAGAYCLGLDGFTLAEPLGMLCGVLLVPIVHDLARRARPAHRGPGALVAPFLLAVSGPFAIWSASGLENAWFALLLTASVHRAVVEAEHGGPPWSGLGFLLVAWTRPEGILYGVVAGALRTRDSPRSSLGFWAILLGGSAVLEAARIAYFAWPLPNSWYAKRVPVDAWLDPAGRGWAQLEQYASRSWQGFALPLYAIGVAGVRGPRARVALAAVGLIAVLYAFPGPLRLQRAVGWPVLPDPPASFEVVRLLIVCASGAALPLAAVGRPGEAARLRIATMVAAGLGFWLGAGGDWMGGFRFASFTAPLACVWLALGIGELADLVQRWRSGGPGWGPEATWVGAGLAGIALVPGTNLTRDHRTANFDVTTAMVEHRVRHVRDVGARLRWEGPVVVADMDVGGYLWFAPDVEVLDLVGLVDVPVARHHRAGPRFLHPYVFERRRPDLVHLHGPDWGWAVDTRLMEHPDWAATYVQLRPYPDVPGVPHDPHPGLWLRRERLFGPDPDPAFAWPLAPGWTLEAVPVRDAPRRSAGDTVGWSLPLRRAEGAGPLAVALWGPDGTAPIATWSTDDALLDPEDWPADEVSRTHVWWPSPRAPAPAGRVGISVEGGPRWWFDTTLAPDVHVASGSAQKPTAEVVDGWLAAAREAESQGDRVAAHRLYERVVHEQPWRSWARRGAERTRTGR